MGNQTPTQQDKDSQTRLIQIGSGTTTTTTTSNTSSFSKLFSSASESFEEEGEEEIKGYCYNILLSGSGESGKSTLLRQIRRFASISEKLHGRIPNQEDMSFNKTELEGYKKFIEENLIKITLNCLTSIRKHDLKLSNDSNEEFSNIFFKQESHEIYNYINFTSDFLIKLTKLWKDPIMIEIFQKYQDIEFHVPDGFFKLIENPDEFERYETSNLRISESDVVFIHRKTVGITKCIFQFDTMNIQFFDTGGQVQERLKWKNVIEKNDMRMVIHVISLSEYNQFLYENDTERRFDDSLNLFEKLISNEDLKSIPWIILFNKKDVLEKKVKKFPLKYYFDDVKEEEEEIDPIQFIVNKFKEKIKFTNYEIKIISCLDQNSILDIIKSLEEEIIL